MTKDVILIVVNGHVLFVPVQYDETLASLGQCALAAMKYGDTDLKRWRFSDAAGETLPHSMPVRELDVADDTRPDVFMGLHPGFGA